MRVLHLIQRYPPAVGGAEAWCAGLARRQARLGHEVEVMTLAVESEEEFFVAPPKDVPRRVQPGEQLMDGVTIRRYEPTRLNPFGIRRSTSPTLSSPALDSLFDRLPLGPHSFSLYAALPGRIRWADVVHLHALPFPHNRVGYLTARALRKPVVMTPHFHVGHPAFEKRAVFSLLAGMDAIFADSSWESAYFAAKGVPMEKIEVTGTAIEPGRYSRPATPKTQEALRQRLQLLEPAPLVTFLGRKIRQKGLEVLLAAAPLVLERLPHARIVLAGPGSEWFEAEHGRLPAHVRRSVLDAGTLSEEEKVALLQESRVLVLPGEHEAFGIVFLEAWACGIPVVGARLGPVAEVVDEGGLTFTPHDPADLAQKICEILEDDALAARLASQGHEYVEKKYSWERIVDVVEEVYGRVLK